MENKNKKQSFLSAPGREETIIVVVRNSVFRMTKEEYKKFLELKEEWDY